MRTKTRMLVDFLCFGGMGAVLGVCGIHFTDWRYWVIFGAVLVIALVQWVCGLEEGSK